MAITTVSLRSAHPRTLDSFGSEIAWTQPVPGVWSAMGDGGLAGLVEQDGTVFSATTASGDDHGHHPSLVEAQAAVTAAESAARLLDDDRLAPRSRATIALVAVVSSIAFASLVGAWLTSSL